MVVVLFYKKEGSLGEQKQLRISCYFTLLWSFFKVIKIQLFFLNITM